jgi:hypothetical protein
MVHALFQLRCVLTQTKNPGACSTRRAPQAEKRQWTWRHWTRSKHNQKHRVRGGCAPVVVPGVSCGTKPARPGASGGRGLTRVQRERQSVMLGKCVGSVDVQCSVSVEPGAAVKTRISPGAFACTKRWAGLVEGYVGPLAMWPDIRAATSCCGAREGSSALRACTGTQSTYTTCWCIW